MKLTETTTLTSADLPIAAFSDYMRLGSGFADDGSQNALLETVLRAAIGAIEARIGKITIARDFVWQVNIWRRDQGAQVLPVAPVNAIVALVLTDAAGGESLIDPASYHLDPDSQRPRLVANSGNLPEVPSNGFARVAFEAGFGIWDDVPPDLRQAVFLLAANYYENRNELTRQTGQMPFGVLALIESYRDIRIGGGV